MNNLKPVLFFDLFFTLISPKYCEAENENDLLGLSINEWEKYAEDEALYFRRASGCINNAKEIISEIFSLMGRELDCELIDQMVEQRELRMKKALLNIDEKILHTLNQLKIQGYPMCIISNADVIDTKYWEDSALSKIFDACVFSHQVGVLKPAQPIYQWALDLMKADPSQSYFIGDGGSNELEGAKTVGMRTIQTGYLIGDVKSKSSFADFYIEDFKAILEIAKRRS